MPKIIKFPEINHFGACPKCGQTDGGLNVGGYLWFLCRKHKTKWWFGDHTYAKWEWVSQEEYNRYVFELAVCKTVDPVLPGKTIPQGTETKIRKRK